MGDGDGDSASNKRKRITQACDSCNKKKIKCDGLKPTCTNCSKSTQQCSYSRGAKKRGPRAGYIESLENRLKEMEALLQPLQPEIVVADMVRQNMEVWPMMDKNAPEGTTRPLPLESDPSNSSLGSSTSPNMNIQSNDPSTIVDAEIIGNQGFSHRQASMKFGSRLVGSGGTSLSSSSTAHIPPEAIRELLDLYFHYIHPTMPLVHMNSFMSNFANESPLLLNSMYALAARYSNHPSIRTSPDMLYNNGDIFYNKARELVDHYMDVPNTSTVTALLCLATYAAGSGRGSAAWMYSGMAIRMAQELKLNIEPEFDESNAVGARMTWLERERRRRIWWTCFILDRYAGAAADRSMIINEKDCKVYLPSNEGLWKSVTNSSEEPLEAVPSNGAFQISVLTSTSAFTPGVPMQNPFGYFVLLTKIFGKIIEYTNMHKASGKNGAASNFVNGPLGAPAKLAQGQDPDFQLSILDASLRNWFGNIPDWMRNLNGEFTDELASENPPSFGVAYLHIFYHTCLILLHRPKMMTILRENPKNVQRSPAFSVCHNSASEVTAVIRKVQGVNPDLYYMTAFVAFCIFQSGLIHVMAAQVSSDAQVVENSKRNADLHVSALAGVAKYWFMAGRLHSVLKNLIESAGLMKEAGFLTMTGASAAESDGRSGMQMAAGMGMPSGGGPSVPPHLRQSPPVLVQQGGIRDGSPNNGLPMGVPASWPQVKAISFRQDLQDLARFPYSLLLIALAWASHL
ncbi:fungal-specific transcription factor domain-containing protein [Chytridium lagenaria]|nr:fungal-specific transcription factor domain-containing protein [Chytridium lagenaria]